MGASFADLDTPYRGQEAEMSDTKTKPPAAAPYNSGRRGRGAPAMKLMGSLRGEGALLSSAGETPVSYQLDVFQGGQGRTGSGTLDGPMPTFEEEANMDAKLRMSDGRTILVSLQAVDEEGAMFDARGELPDPA
jgi:hypothetical protein